MTPPVVKGGGGEGGGGACAPLAFSCLPEEENKENRKEEPERRESLKQQASLLSDVCWCGVFHRRCNCDRPERARGVKLPLPIGQLRHRGYLITCLLPDLDIEQLAANHCFGMCFG